MRPISWVAMAVGLAQQPLVAQPQVSTANFDVASIRQHTAAITEVAILVSGTRVTVTAYALLGLIMDAYKLEPYRIAGRADWMDNDRYDITARAPGENPPTSVQVETMLQTLLADRFQLRFHRETRQLPGYALALGRNGPKLQASPADAAPRMSLRGSGLVNQLSVSKEDMDQLAKQLASAVGRPVVDRTGLTGSYDFQLSWSSDDVSTALSGRERPPSIFTALQEQLGLKLESTRGPVELLVIDHAEKPTPN